MIKFKVIPIVLGLLMLLVAPAPHLLAGDGYVTIDQPDVNSTLSGVATIYGHTVITPTEVSLETSTALGGPFEFASSCQYSTANYNFYCYWNTTKYSNARYFFRVNSNFGGTWHVSDPVSVNISNYEISLPVITPSPASSTSSGSGSTSNPTPTRTPTRRPSPTPTPAPSIALPSEQLMTSSQLLASITFNKDVDGPVRLEKIEARLSAAATQFILFSGQTKYANSLITITVHSQPIVMTTISDGNGNWSYTLTDPLDPGQHEAYVEVVHNGKVEKSSNYAFSVAQAAASESNPSGIALEAANPQKQASIFYLEIAGAVVVLALIALMIILYLKKRKNPQTNKPVAKN